MNIKRVLGKVFSPLPHREGLGKSLLGMGLFILLFCAVGCKNPQPATVNPQPVVNIQFLADSAFAYCQAQCDFGPRIMNSEAHERCAQWIQQKFEQFGCNVEMQQANLIGYDGTTLRSTNIIAHHSSPDTTHQVPTISGVGVMLELARLVQQYGDSLNVNVDFVCFDAEDWGIPQWSNAPDNGRSWALGSQHWAAQYAQNKSQTYQYGILLDMVGGQGARFYQESMSLKYARSVVDKVWAAASVAGYGSMFPNDEGSGITFTSGIKSELSQSISRAFDTSWNNDSIKAVAAVRFSRQEHLKKIEEIYGLQPE